MKAEIISIGTEILLGKIFDTNAFYLASQLPLLGVDLHWVTTVGDNRERLVDCFSRALERSDLILATGGLGPTEDDLTREAIATVLGEEHRVDLALLERLRSLFARIGREMPPHNIKQATLIPSAQAIPNPRGTAPGWWVEREGKIIVAMPGPPGEMQPMWEKEVMPRLRQSLLKGVILTRTLKSFGLSEAQVDEMLPISSFTNPELGIYAKPDGIHLCLIARAPDHQKAEELLAQGEARVRQILGDHLWGSDNDTLEGIIGTFLTKRGLTLATMESFTGGLLATYLTDAPGSSAYYHGGMVAYSKEVMASLGVEAQLISRFGAVSVAVAEAMATIARQRLGADIGIGITGVAGPDKLEGKPPGLVFVAICDDRGKQTREWNFPLYPQEVKRRAAIATLFMLRQKLMT